MVLFLFCVYLNHVFGGHDASWSVATIKNSLPTSGGDDYFGESLSDQSGSRTVIGGAAMEWSSGQVLLTLQAVALSRKNSSAALKLRLSVWVAGKEDSLERRERDFWISEKSRMIFTNTMI